MNIAIWQTHEIVIKVYLHMYVIYCTLGRIYMYMKIACNLCFNNLMMIK